MFVEGRDDVGVSTASQFRSEGRRYRLHETYMFVRSVSPRIKQGGVGGKEGVNAPNWLTFVIRSVNIGTSMQW